MIPFRESLGSYELLILDMNDTFMFGHDRFGPAEEYGLHFRRLGGTLPVRDATAIVQAAYDYLAARYPDPRFHEHFPSLRHVFERLLPRRSISEDDLRGLIATFAHHEKGQVPEGFRKALADLASRHRLAVAADIWAPRGAWLEEFEGAGVLEHFSAVWFSSDQGIVKPSPRPFLHLLRILDACPETTLVIGDSVRRDLGGAVAAGLPCLLVGGEEDAAALGAASSLLELVE